jgi:hypothetical protein
MGRVGWRIVAVVLTGVGVLTFGLFGRAQAQEVDTAPAPVRFDQPSLTIGEGGRGRLTLLNDTTSSLLVSVRVSPADAFSIEASATSIIPGGGISLTITDVGGGVGARGSVIAVAAAPPGGNPLAPRAGGVARADVTVGAASRPAEPLVDEWSVTSYRFMPWGDPVENDVLPLRDATACADVDLPDGETVGGVSSSPGAARVTASCTEDGAIGADTGAALDFPGLAHHTGDYDGEIDLAGVDGAGDGVAGEGGVVELSVRRTDYFLLPLVVALLGVAAALAAAGRVGRLDRRAADDRGAYLLLADVDEAHRAFRAKAHDTTWVGYSFKTEADQRVRTVLGTRTAGIDGNGNGAGGSGRAGKAAAEDRLVPVATAAAAWPALADRLAELDVAVTEVGLKSSSHRPASAASNEPACLAVARPLLTGRRLDVEDALATADAVDDAATMAEHWLDWASTAGLLDSRTELLALAIDDLPADHEDQSRLAAARADLSTARTGLWAAEDLADLRDRGVLAAIGDARTLLDGLDHHVSDDLRPVYDPGDAGELEPRGTSPLAAALAGAGAGTGLRAGSGSGARRSRASADRSRSGRRVRGAITLAATGLVAVWTGLTVLYTDQAFGTPADYAGIFVWGFAAQAVLGTLAALAPRRPAGSGQHSAG